MDGKPLRSPDETSITAVLVRATLRDAMQSNAAAKEAAPKINYSRYQDSIPTMIDYGFSNVAVAASKVPINHWRKAQKPVVFLSQPVPLRVLLASNKLRDT
jgi:phosphonate transport system substrate-binding protein